MVDEDEKWKQYSAYTPQRAPHCPGPGVSLSKPAHLGAETETESHCQTHYSKEPGHTFRALRTQFRNLGGGAGCSSHESLIETLPGV